MRDRAPRDAVLVVDGTAAPAGAAVPAPLLVLVSGRTLFAPARAQAEVGVRLKQMVDDYSGWHFVNQNPERAVSPPALGRLGAIRSPTLVLVGERDLPDFHRMSERLERDIPGARRASVAGAGHMANMEAPEAVNKALGGFLASG